MNTFIIPALTVAAQGLGDCLRHRRSHASHEARTGLRPTGFDHTIAERLARRMGATFIPLDASGPEIRP